MNDTTRAALAANVARVRKRIDAACDQAGRPTDSVRLIAVSKYVDAAATRALVDHGVTTLGEARPQSLWKKAGSAELSECEIEWRLIGHLQRNKVERTLPLVASIDSVDSPRLLTAINAAAASRAAPAPVLIEVNISGDGTKHGFAPDELPELLNEVEAYPRVRIDGLMTMAAREGGPEVARRNFAALRDLRDRVATPATPLRELSMGMTNDFEQAILEGSTMVRVGSALWEGIR